MAFSALDIYKLLPKTNCRECGFVTCLAFAMHLAKKAVTIDKCPYLSEEAKRILLASSLPPIKLISIGKDENKLEIGNETVLFRHEEKFQHPSGIGFIIDDDLSTDAIKERADKINSFKFERVGQELNVNLIAIRQTGGKEKFIDAVRLILKESRLALVLMTNDLETLKEALELTKNKNPLVYYEVTRNLEQAASVLKDFKAPVIVSETDLEKLSNLVIKLNELGVSDLVLDSGNKSIADKVWDLTQIRRQALKKSNRSLGYPAIAIIQKSDPFEEVIEAATYILKYAGIVLLEGIESWQVLSLLTLRQNIYTDPQKPLQIEPKLYSVGKVSDKSPLIVTTNFSLTYFTVLGEVEASKIPAYILSVDTEGMSVLTAWAAEKFTPDKISASLNKSNVNDAVSHKNLVIPGYVAMLSGELEEKSGWKIIVGPKEAAGLPSFLKNL